MDTQQDFEPFSALLDQLCATWNRPANDDLAKAYWSALKDVRLSEIRTNVERILRTATGKQPFPKPAELRNEAPKDKSVAARQAFENGETFCVANLEALRRTDPEAWRRDTWLRKLDRLLVTEPVDSPIYAQALDEARRLRPLVRGH